jgi:hypothetical protein
MRSGAPTPKQRAQIKTREKQEKNKRKTREKPEKGQSEPRANPKRTQSEAKAGPPHTKPRQTEPAKRPESAAKRSHTTDLSCGAPLPPSRVAETIMAIRRLLFALL